MRRHDADRLTKPYGPVQDVPSPGPAAALGVDVPSVKVLEDAIFSDLSPGPPFGVSWWAPHPGSSRRVLASDQLLCCVTSTEANLIEAALHWLEFLDYSEQESDMFADAVQMVGGEPVIKSPKRDRPIDDIVLDMCDLHILGVARALSGALDCLAGAIVGVVALKASILRADFGIVHSRVLPKLPAPENDGQQKQTDFAQELNRVIANAGPAGWLSWILDLRNMLVHRGRRLTLSQFVPRQPVLFGPNGDPVPRVRVIRQLPRDPGRSDVEVLRFPESAPVLTEDASQTLEGLIRSVRYTTEATAALLVELWHWRRANPSALLQPTEQWKDGLSTASTGFDGYAPGSFKYEPGMLISHPLVAKRLRSAALDDKYRPEWQAFD
jgi:hypothetical protein